MAKINLLPWREEHRKQQQHDFVMSLVAAAAMTCFLFFLVYMQIDAMKEYQQKRNKVVQDEITLVDKKITEIKDIESKKRKLMTKIDVIQKLQESRPEIVHLFDELAKSIPEGVFLTKFKQTGKSLELTGKAQSNARVSSYMRGVEASSWLESPVLKVIKGQAKTSNGQLNDFSMIAKQGNQSLKDKEGKK
jgi:type IV pilus assembly protein PilN